MCREWSSDFVKLPTSNIQKPDSVIVGEILVKFAHAANNHLVELLESEGAEAVVPDLLDFFLYCFYNANFKAEKLGMSKSSARKCNLGIKALEWLRSAARDEFEKSAVSHRLPTLKNLPAMPVRSFPKETRPEKAGS